MSDLPTCKYKIIGLQAMVVSSEIDFMWGIKSRMAPVWCQNCTELINYLCDIVPTSWYHFKPMITTLSKTPAQWIKHFLLSNMIFSLKLHSSKVHLLLILIELWFSSGEHFLLQITSSYLLLTEKLLATAELLLRVC